MYICTLEDIVPRYFARSLSSNKPFLSHYGAQIVLSDSRNDWTQVHVIMDDTQDWIVQMFQVIPKSQVF